MAALFGALGKFIADIFGVQNTDPRQQIALHQHGKLITMGLANMKNGRELPNDDVLLIRSQNIK